jgi:hypothetical protein
MSDLRVTFKTFDSKMASREKLFKAAADFASQIPRDRIITLSHSEDRDNIVITLWYWTDESEGTEAKARLAGNWKKPEMKATGAEKLVPTKAAVTGEPLGKNDPVRPPAHPTMEMPRKNISPNVPERPHE